MIQIIDGVRVAYSANVVQLCDKNSLLSTSFQLR